MAKKTRRPNLPHDTRERARRELSMTGPVVEARKPTESAQPAAAAALNKAQRVVPQTDLRTQYAYVLNDLRNMAVLAAGLMIVLVILSFFI
jgi:hypothetical protein